MNWRRNHSTVVQVPLGNERQSIVMGDATALQLAWALFNMGRAGHLALVRRVAPAVAGADRDGLSA